MSPATAPDENDCYREIYEPAHDQMIRDLVAKYDCAPGGSGAATPASRDKKASGQSTKSNVLLYGIGALALVGIGVAVYASRNKYGANPVEEEGEEQCEVEEEGEEQCEVPDDEELRTSATISDRRGGGYYAAFDGKQIGTYGSMNEAIGALNRKMQSTEYYPNIYYVNERGNVDLLDQRGVVLASWV
jgi:hypothetical protein